MSTSPGPGTGSAISSSRRTSGDPNSRITIAFMASQQRLLLGMQLLVDEVQHDRGTGVVAHQRREVHETARSEDLQRLRERRRVDLPLTEQLSAEADDQRLFRP